MRLDFSHHSEHEFRHNFADSLNPLCSCSLESESTLHFFLCCQNYTTFCRAFMTDLKNISDTIISLNENDGNKNFYSNMNISSYTNCDYQIYQSVKSFINLFLNIIKTILIPSSIPFLIFLISPLYDNYVFCLNVL